MKKTQALLAVVLSASMLSAPAVQAFPSAPARDAVAGATQSKSNVEDVRYYGRRGWGGHGWRGGRGLGIAAGIIGGAVIAGALSDDYYYRRHRYGYVDGGGARQRCADTYRSFDWRSGTYLGYDGYRHVCPYL